MDTKALKQKILDLAIHGRLVPQDPNDEPASILLQRIREEKQRLIKEGKIKKGKKTEENAQAEDAPFEVPEGWMWTTVEEIGEVITGNTPSKDVTDYYGGNIPFFKPTDLEQGVHTITAKDHLTESGYEQSRKLPAKSVLVTCIGATIGKTGLIETDGTCNQQINAIIPSNAILSIFLYYLCISPYLQQEIKANASATTLPILNKNNFAAIPIPLPPLTEQRRIVAEIERWFGLIDIVERGKESLNSAVKQAKAKILDLAIHGRLVPQDPNDEPASTLLQRINPKAEIVEDNDEYGDVPQGWCVCDLKEVSTIVTGSTPSKANLKNYGGTFPFFKPADLDAGRHVIRASEYLSEEGKNNARIIPAGSVAVCCIGSIGKVGYIEEEGTTNQQINSAIPNDAIKSEYLYFLCSSDYFCNSLKAKSSAVTIAIVNKGKMEDIKIPLPPLAEQHRIVAKIEELFVLLDKIESSL